MFKTKVELIRENNEDSDFGYYHGCFGAGVRSAFISFSERVEFYKEYKDEWEKLPNDVKFKWQRYSDEFIGGFWNDMMDSYQKRLIFNRWLFDYCFEDVIE